MNLATNQVKLSRKERGRPGSFGKISGKLISMQTPTSGTDTDRTNKFRGNLEVETRVPLKSFDLSPCSSSAADSSVTSYPSSIGISRDTTASSFSSSWISGEFRGERRVFHEAGWRNAREVGHGSESQSLKSESLAKTPSYVYSDSLEDFDDAPPRDQELPKNLRDSQIEQWWMDYIFKKFNIGKLK